MKSMPTTAEREAKEREEKARQKEAFHRFMEQPMTKMAVSMIPAGENKETLITLLETTFDVGVHHGAGSTMMTVLDAFFTNKDRKDNNRG